MEQKVTSPIQKGIIITLLLIVFGLIIYFTNQMANEAIGYIQYVILIGGIMWSCIYYAKQMNGNVTFGNVFAHGFKTTAVVTSLIIVYTFIAMKFLFPDIIDMSMNIAKKKMEQGGNLSDDDIQKSLEWLRRFIVPITIGAILLFFAIFGAIGSLLGAAFAKKNPQSPFSQQQI